MSTSETELQSIFQLQSAKVFELRKTSPKERIKKIQKIRDWVLQHQSEICDALHADFKKSAPEVEISEIMPVVGEANYIAKHLGYWMQPKSVPVPLLFLGTSNKSKPQAKGKSLIISPWNYPFNLSIKPLLSAIAAGCSVILKPSELTPHTSALIKKMMEELFDQSEVFVALGDADTAIALQKLPFDHLFFTGSPNVGKKVMAAAAEHLTSVTLELGGKSPAVIDQSADLKKAASKIAFSKFLNAGQTCIAIDYVLIQEEIRDKFIELITSEFEEMSNRQFESTDDFCQIINSRNFERIYGMIKEAESKGAKVKTLGKAIPEQRKLAPTLLYDLDHTSEILKEEIFGPVLPILTYKNLSEAISYINAKPKALSTYVYSKKNSTLNAIVNETASGPVVQNDFGLQFIYHGVPFGGIGNSGLGVSGGYEGFLEFSHMKTVIKNHFNPSKIFYPPYNNSFTNAIRGFVIKYLS